MQRVAAEAAERMDDDEIERLVGALRLVDHLLEDRPIVVERRSARLGEDLGDLPALALAIRAALGDLVGQREIALGLARSGDANVDGGAGHYASPFIAQDGLDLFGKKGPPEREFAA